MFSLFTQKRHPLSKLYSHYSQEEKSIILAILYLAGSCDNAAIGFSNARIEKELNVLNSLVDIFGVKAEKSLSLMQIIGPDRLILKLASFEKSKIDTVLIMVVEMLCCDGKPNEEELNFLFTVLDSVNISPAVFMNQIQTNDVMYRYFMA
tara:strand:- start:198 stop:647 length:450 start_codon:yes stop_codon:yes gene_type:complete